jgi:hypothetical protein
MNLEILTKDHKFTKINLCHFLSKIIELAILGDMLSRVEMEDFHQASATSISQILSRFFIL